MPSKGLPTLIGVAKTDGSRADFVYDEDVAFVFTGPCMMAAYKNGVVDDYETAQLTCRVKYWAFSRAAPEQRNRSFKPCALCWSRWLLQGEVAWQANHGIPPDTFTVRVIAALAAAATPSPGARPAPAAAVTPPSAAASSACPLPLATEPQQPHAETFFQQLTQLMAWRQAGLLSDTEFAKAKSMLGLC